VADVFTPELTFGSYQSGIETPTAPGAPYRTIQLNAFTPASLFLTGAQGIWLDPYDLSTMFQTGTRGAPGTPVSADGQPVGCWLDKSGNLNDFLQATAGARPIFHTSSGLNWVEFDGVDDFMAPTTGNLSASPQLAVIGALTLASSGGGMVFLTSNAGTADGAGGFMTAFKPALGANGPASGRLADGVTGTELYEHSAPATPRTMVQTWQFNFAGALNTDEVKIRRSGVDQTLDVASAGPVSTINLANSPFVLAALNGGGQFFAGKIYGLIALGGGGTATQISNSEAYLAGKSGVTLG
jgi:hypothetical protein